MYNGRPAQHRVEIRSSESAGAAIREGFCRALCVCGTGCETQSVDLFFNKIQVTCVGAHVDEFVINGSDHALIYIHVIGSKEQLSAIST